MLNKKELKNFFSNKFMIIILLLAIIFCLNIKNAKSKNIEIFISDTSNLPIHAVENESSIANMIAIVGGKGLKNSQGKSRNYLVKQKDIFVDSELNFYLLPNYSKKEDANYHLRISNKRMQRILALVDAIKVRNNKPIFIVGFSRGSVDAGSFGKKYSDRINGIVLASGIYTNESKRAETYSMEIIIGNHIKTPTLVAHHSDDLCHVTPFSYAESFYHELNAPSKKLISYSGGSATGRACGPLNHHGFEGIEEVVARDISAWIISQVEGS